MANAVSPMRDKILKRLTGRRRLRHIRLLTRKVIP